MQLYLIQRTIRSEISGILTDWITLQFVPTNNCVLFVHVKLAFAALLSGAVWVDRCSSTFSTRVEKAPLPSYASVPANNILKSRLVLCNTFAVLSRTA